MSESVEARLQRLEDLQAIQQLFVDYGEHLDAGDFDSYSRLFADDGEVLLGPMGRAQGPAAIKELMERQLADHVGTTFHLITSPRISLDGDAATATVMWTVLAANDDGPPTVTMVGHHLDRLVRVDGKWRFKRRRGTMNLPAVMPR